MLGRDPVQIEVLVLQGVIELVGVGDALGGTEAAVVRHDEQRLHIGVVDADHLIGEQIELNLNEVLRRFEQAERHQLLLI